MPSERTSPTTRAACLTCRQRKTACNRARPKCSFCSKNGFDCDYVTAQRTPGLRAGYVSQLERRLERLEARMNQVEADHSGCVSMQIPAPSVAHESPATLFPSGSAEIGDSDRTSETMLSLGASLATRIDGTWPNANVTAGLVQSGSRIGLDLDTSSPESVSTLCSIWFDLYHPWFPILHQPSLLESLQAAADIESCDRRLVVKAIVAVTMGHNDQRYASTLAERQERADQLRTSVMLESMGDMSLRALQALLILSLIDFGLGRMTEFWHVMSICKRLSVRMGLEAVVREDSERSNYDNNILSRSAPINNTIIDREEHVRAFWMTEMLDNMSTLGTAWTTHTAGPVAHTPLTLPCSDALWAFPEHIISVWSMGQFRYSSAFSLCIILVETQVNAVQDFLRQPVDFTDKESMLQWQSEAQAIDDRLTSWREEFVASVFRLINAELPQVERSEMDPNIVLTNCLLNMAIVVMFQRLVQLPTGIETSYEAWPYATNRCVYACENMAAKVRRMDDLDLLNGNPHLIPCLFVSARFFIVWSKALEADVPSNLRYLAYALHLSGQRWPQARRYEAVVRTAVAEHRTPVPETSLPRQFYDLRFSALDIDPFLRAWADEQPI